MSRWIDVPANVREAGDGRLPGGFRAAGVAAGLKASGELDVGLISCSAADCVSAARFTRSGVLAAPVLVTQER
jgi:glutamate N-acetyltransferase/amino-acid N-acetyltransferase